MRKAAPVFSVIRSSLIKLWLFVFSGIIAGIAGAVLVNYAKTYLTGAFPEIWLYFLGALSAPTVPTTCGSPLVRTGGLPLV
jgi:ribose/xylose/arabinose/galactoside ABC-type transport system permease subunit